DVILESIADHLENWLGFDVEHLGGAAQYGQLTAQDLPEAFGAIKKLLLAPVRSDQDRKRLEKQLAQLKTRVAKGRRNLALVDAENIPAVQQEIRRWEREVARAEHELAQSKPPAEKDVNEVAVEVLNNLYALAACCHSLAQPSHIDSKGRRVIEHGDGTV